MKLIALLVMLLNVAVANAQSDTQEVSNRYNRFQVEWRLISLEMSEGKRDNAPGIIVKVAGEHFESVRDVPPDP